MSYFPVRALSIRPIHLSIPLLRRLPDVVERDHDWTVPGTSGNDGRPQEATPAENGMPTNNGWQAKTSLPQAAPRKSVSTSRMLFMLTLLVTGATVMKIVAMVSRGREFHPNWAAKGSKMRGLHTLGD